MLDSLTRRAAILLAAGTSTAFAANSATAQILTTGTDDGGVTVTVDAFGSFGSAVGGGVTDAIYNPVGAIDAAGTAYESGIAIGFGGGRTFLTSGDIGGTSGGSVVAGLSGTSTTVASAFTFEDLAVDLTQAVTPTFNDLDERSGSRLRQTYTITNTGAAPVSFDVIRYIDGDLDFDGSINDGGGLLPGGILFQTDAGGSADDDTTFVGITASGGTVPASNRFEIDEYSGLRSRIVDGMALDNTVTGDGDADQFIDAGNEYDVTLAFRNAFTLDVGESAVYTTDTLFGSGAPAAVPEPTTLALAGLGGFGLLARRRR